MASFMTGVGVLHPRGNIYCGRRITYSTMSDYYGNRFFSISVPTNASSAVNLARFLDSYISCSLDEANMLLAYTEERGEFTIELDQLATRTQRMCVFGREGFGRGYTIQDCFENWVDLGCQETQTKRLETK